MKKLFTLCILSLILGFSNLAKADFPWGSTKESISSRFPGGKTKCKNENCDYLIFQKDPDLKEGIYILYMFRENALNKVMYMFSPPEDKGTGTEEMGFLNKKQTNEVVNYLTNKLSASFGNGTILNIKNHDLALLWDTDNSTVLVLEVCDKAGTIKLPTCQPIAIFKSKLTNL